MTENTPSTTGPAWTVTTQAERTIISSTGDAIDVMQVGFQLADGTLGTVNVPLSAYTVDNVRAAITAKAAVLAGVGDLSA